MIWRRVGGLELSKREGVEVFGVAFPPQPKAALFRRVGQLAGVVTRWCKEESCIVRPIRFEIGSFRF